MEDKTAPKPKINRRGPSGILQPLVWIDLEMTGVSSTFSWFIYKQLDVNFMEVSVFHVRCGFGKPLTQAHHVECLHTKISAVGGNLQLL